MTLLERAVALFTDAVVHTGRFAPLVLFASSFVEYVFPPFPGDTIVILGAWYAVHGALSWPAAFVAVTAGAVAGAFLDWKVGRWLAPRLEAGAAHGLLDAGRLAHFEAAYRRWGALLLVANRFMPGVRAFLFVAAGASGIPLRRVLLLGGISAALWNALLLAAGGLLARNVPELIALFERYTWSAWVALGIVAAVLGVRALVRRCRPGGAAS